MNHKEIAKQYAADGLSVILLNDKKGPCLTSWDDLKRSPLTESEIDDLFDGKTIRPDAPKPITMPTAPSWIGILTGEHSDNTEVIDVDTKNDDTGHLWDDLWQDITTHLPEIAGRLVVVRTPSGGCHIYYRSTTIAGKTQIAKAKDGRVLIETTLYVVAPPSEGYEFIQGSLEDIVTIDEDQRDILWGICKGYNQLTEGKVKPTKREFDGDPPDIPEGYLSPISDYNKRADVVSLLCDHGWIVVKTWKENTYLQRPSSPGEKVTEISGNFHDNKEDGKRVFVNWSASADHLFKVGAKYNPSEVYAALKGLTDWSSVSRDLLKLGYGQSLSDYKATTIKTDDISVTTRDGRIISSPGETIRTDDIPKDSGTIIIKSPGHHASDEVIKVAEIITKLKHRIYVVQDGDDYTYGAYLGLKLMIDYTEATTPETAYQVRDDFRLKAVEWRSLLSASDRIDFNHQLTQLTDQGFTEDILGPLEEDHKTAIAEAKRNEKLDNLIKKVNTEPDKGKAVEMMRDGLRDIDTETGGRLMPPITSLASIFEEIKTLPDPFSTGYDLIDSFVKIRPGTTTIIAGYPGHGKTTLMLNMMMRMSDKYRSKKFYFFSYEEPVSNFVLNIINTLTTDDLSEYKRLPTDTNGDLIEQYIKEGRTDIATLNGGISKLRNMIDTGRIVMTDVSYKIEELEKIIKNISREGDVGCVFIDYVQRIRTTRQTKDNRERLGYVSDILKNTAKDLRIPIIFGSQLARASRGANGEEKPKINFLKEAGELEEDATNVLSVYCEAVNLKTQLDEIAIEVKALKNRKGVPGVRRVLKWIRPQYRIADEEMSMDGGFPDTELPF